MTAYEIEQRLREILSRGAIETELATFVREMERDRLCAPSPVPVQVSLRFDKDAA